MKQRLRLKLSATAAGLTLLSLLTAGCVGIPGSSEVRPGLPLSNDEGTSAELVIIPPGPIEGASAEQIVRGFLNAGSGIQNDYEIARKFLTEEAALAWRPSETVTVYSSLPRIQQHEDGSIKATITPEAQISSRSEYLLSAPGSVHEMEFKLVQTEDEQWRIAELPNGTILQRNLFNLLFSSYTVYFYDQAARYLVPDQRWFPIPYTTSSRRNAIVTRVTSLVLDGPADWLDGALLNAFPEGTTISLNGVILEGSTARIDLSDEILATDSYTRQLMRAQLEVSLAAAVGSGVTRVVLSVDRSEINIEDFGQDAPVRNPNINPAPLVAVSSQIGVLEGDSLTALPGLDSTVLQWRPQTLLFDERARVTAFNAVDGVWLYQGRQRSLIDDRAELLPATMDSFGYVFTRQANPHSALLARRADGEPLAVQADWLEGYRVEALKLSRDSSRMAALVHSSEGYRLLIAAVVRGEEHAPLELKSPIVIRQGSNVPVDVVWTGENTLVAATLSHSTGEYILQLHTVGGESEILGTPPGVQSLSGSASSGQVRVLTADGRVLQLQDNGWQEIGSGVSVLGEFR